MKVAYFTHSIQSCWNHGNAHFLRGVLRELIAQGHDAVAYEPHESWSRANLVADHGEPAARRWRAFYPEIVSHRYRCHETVAERCADADLVIVHEWNDPSLASALGKMRKRGARWTLLFHDTHHRAVSDSQAMRTFDLSGFDGVLAFGDALAEVYRRWGWGRRAFVWHEAADVRLFRPPDKAQARAGLVWIGNWGDGERTAELQRFLLRPARAAGLPLDIHGVRYPQDALDLLQRHGARYRGWLANAEAPSVFERHLATVHVPRRFYVEQLPGIPTIRVFEALACGIPLVTAPWSDSEHLFRAGEDLLVARTSAEMTSVLRAVHADAELRAALARSGLDTIRARHTCAHRAAELLRIVRALRRPQAAEEATL